jgi:hypothetical protein
MPTAAFSVNSSGDNALSIGTAGKTLRIIELYLVAAAAVTVTIKAGTAGGAVTVAGPMSLITGTPLEIARNPDGHWNDKFNAAAQGTDLNISLGGAQTVGGWVDYTLF